MVRIASIYENYSIISLVSPFEMTLILLIRRWCCAFVDWKMVSMASQAALAIFRICFNQPLSKGQREGEKDPRFDDGISRDLFVCWWSRRRGLGEQFSDCALGHLSCYNGLRKNKLRDLIREMNLLKRFSSLKCGLSKVDTSRDANKAFRYSTNYSYIWIPLQVRIMEKYRYDISSFLSNTTYSFQQIDTAYPLPLDTAYRSSGTEAEIFDFRAKFYLSLGQILLIVYPLFQELLENTFSGSDNEDANEHIEKVLEIVDLFHVPNITVDQLMLRAFHISLTGAASPCLRNKPTGSIKTWEDLKTKFLNKYCPPGRTAKKIEEINNFHQEPDETLFQAWERFKELLMKCPQHYLTEMQETAEDAKKAIQEMAEYSQKWHNGTSGGRSIETSDGLAAI
ncbi:retrovirus-related pol polyprotein from transposon TNT 1-94 [Tanacetum coccineum]